MIERRTPDWCGQTASVEQTRAVGEAIAHHCRPGDLIALMGELGAGKTQLVKGLCVAWAWTSTRLRAQHL